MALIVRRGDLPNTPHTEFYAIPGVLALEEIHGSYGFDGPWSRKMHVRHYPTEQSTRPTVADFHFRPNFVDSAAIALEPYMIHSGDIPYGGDALRSRFALCGGHSTLMSVIKATEGFPADVYLRNAASHELFFVQEGSGVLSSEFGELPFKQHDYIVVPKATTYRIDLHEGSVWLLLIESKFPYEWPPHYMNRGGQAHMTAPIVETEIGVPDLQPFRDEVGEFTVFIKAPGGTVTESKQSHHPFDVSGWEGALYPFTFPILNHHGIAREIHTAPPMHNTFQSGHIPNTGFSVCSFVPQMEGWHPKEVCAPYAHMNVDSDEFMFFCNGSYGARKGIIKDGSISLHQGGVPHSPHGKAAERSLANRGKIAERLAVMLDTYFEPLTITVPALEFCDPEYSTSWSRAAQPQ
jgi:homogentisate 1,2-dioxygenase